MTNQQGLSSAEVKARLKTYGLNAIDAVPVPTWIEILARQFQSPLVYLLVAASIISFFLGDVVDAVVIWGAVIANVAVGFVQENRAQTALLALRSLVTVKARVIRDGEERIIDSRQLVPGDLVLVGAGAKVPADIRLEEAINLEVNEAVLTGESVPVTKIAGVGGSGPAKQRLNENQLFMGTMVVRGQGKGVVVATGRQTKMGEVARLVSETQEEKTPLQRQLNSLSKVLVGGVLVISTLIFLVGIIGGGNLGLMFATGVALAVAAIPEGLALAVTVTLVLGMQKILARQALVRNLLAIDTLGATTVICTDKTGTLTTGKMALVEVVLPDVGGKDKRAKVGEWQRIKLTEQSASDPRLRRLLTIGALCNEAMFDNGGGGAAWEVIGSPTETALLTAAAKAGLVQDKLTTAYPRLTEIPFESQAQFMATLHKVSRERAEVDSLELAPNSNLVMVKGSPERVAAMLSDPIDQDIIEALTSAGLRVLLLAYKEVPLTKKSLSHQDLEGLTLAGIVGLIDPLRPEAKEAIARCQSAGLIPVMLTGDHRLTAKAIAQELGLPVSERNLITGPELRDLSEPELLDRVESLRVYARVTPKDKIRIVDAWQTKGEVVAMTGDGVNDAPALKSADIGVALGSGTDVAKETADIVLLDNNFSTIVSAIEGGRVVFDNIRKVALYLLSDSFSEVILVLGSLLAGWPLPLLPAQILYINILTDGFPDIALTYEPEEKEVMDEPPRGRSEPILNFEIKVLIGLISSFTGLGSLVIFYLAMKTTHDLALARTIVFATLGLDSLLYVFSVRSLRHSFFGKNPFGNQPLIVAVVIGFILQLVAIYYGPLQGLLQTVSLNRTAWLLVLFQAIMVMTLIEITKHLFIIRRKK